jgi:hypothetical protein
MNSTYQLFNEFVSIFHQNICLFAMEFKFFLNSSSKKGQPLCAENSRSCGHLLILLLITRE